MQFIKNMLNYQIQGELKFLMVGYSFLLTLMVRL